MSTKLHPAVAARIRGWAKDAGFVKAGRSYRCEVDELGGLALAWEEKGPWEDGYRRSHWYLKVCPAAYLDFSGRWAPRLAVPFMKVDLMTASPAHISPLWRVPANAPTSQPGFFEDDPEDVEEFLDHLGHWFTDLALPKGLEWLANPGTMLDAMDEPRHQRNSLMLTHFGGVEHVTRAILAAEAGRRAEAIATIKEMKLWLDNNPEYTPAVREFDALSAMYPELV